MMRTTLLVSSFGVLSSTQTSGAASSELYARSGSDAAIAEGREVLSRHEVLRRRLSAFTDGTFKYPDEFYSQNDDLLFGANDVDAYLFDLVDDPTESTNVYDDSTYTSERDELLARSTYWLDYVREADVPDASVMKTSWKSCGGTCPWLEDSEEDVEAVAATSAIIAEESASSASSSDAPNIVFVLVDDWGYNDAGWRSTYLAWTTPTIDRLGREGVRLNNYFTHGNSVPSRGALLTGRYSLRLGLADSDSDELNELPLDETTLAQEMQSAGYKTYMVGKWGVGRSSSLRTPTKRGFDAFYGFLGDSIDYWDKYETKYNKYQDLWTNDVLVTNEQELSSDLHNAYLLQTKAEEMIKMHAETYGSSASSSSDRQPMFMYYSPSLVQGATTYAVPSVFQDRCIWPDDSSISSATRYDLREYCALNVMLDEVIGNLTCALEANNMSNNTILVIVSDNGGDGNIDGNNFPFHGAKGSYARGGVSVNGILHSSLIPQEMRGGSYNGQMHVTDWLPTLMGLATDGAWTGSLTDAELDGVDMWDAIMNNATSPRTEIVHSVKEDEISIQQDMLKLDVGSTKHLKKPLYTFESDQGGDDAGATSCYEPSLMYVYSVADVMEAEDYNFAFDLSVDPYEDVNVYNSSQYEDRMSDLISRAENWYTKVVAPDEPSTANKVSAWRDAGGVVPWLSNDDDYEEMEIPHKFTSSDDDTKPHLVFVLVDDWGFNDVGYRSTYLSWTTPNIDRLASEGIKLENYYTHFSCVPSRGALLTGRYALRLGLWETGEKAELPLSETTLAQELKSAGYRTYMVGKWHMGFSTPGHLPTARGFDSFYGYLNGQVDYWTKYYGTHLDLQDGDALVTNEDELSSDLHNGYLMETKAEDAIWNHARSHSEKPMFLYYALQLIHGVWSAPDIYLDRCASPDAPTDDYIESVEYNYCALNVMLDEVIGNLTCTLAAAGMSDDTIMVIVSDNGGESTVSGNNFPYRGAKGSHFRGGLSGTGLIHSSLLPEEMRGGSYYGQMHVTDWLPTLMGLATDGAWTGSLTDAELDGVDMWDAIMNNATSPRTEIVHHTDGDYAISIQYDMLKLDRGDNMPALSGVQFVFEKDENPSLSSSICINPSLMVVYSDLASSSALRGAGVMPSGPIGVGGSTTTSSGSSTDTLGVTSSTTNWFVWYWQILRSSFSNISGFYLVALALMGAVLLLGCLLSVYDQVKEHNPFKKRAEPTNLMTVVAMASESSTSSSSSSSSSSSGSTEYASPVPDENTGLLLSKALPN